MVQVTRFFISVIKAFLLNTVIKFLPASEIC